MKHYPSAIVIVATALACGTPSGLEARRMAPTAAIGQTINVGGPLVTPLALLEDSRCPEGARCITAGQLRIKVRIRLGKSTLIRQLSQGKPIAVADGTLTLTNVWPPRAMNQRLKKRDYRFGFQFAGGL
jgi:hypothetical protein